MPLVDQIEKTEAKKYIKRKSKIKCAYIKQKSNAKRRGIAFLLTYGEWLGVWLLSGRMHQRGKSKGQFCMCRKGDVGAYTINNVFIERTTTNVSDGNKGKVLSDFTKSLMSQSKIGKRRKDLEGCNNPMAKSARKINTSEGIFLSAADAARKLGLSKTTAYRRCSNPNFADWFYLNTNKA